jgi:hypothetical protein
VRTYLRLTLFSFLICEAACIQAVSFYDDLQDNQKTLWLKLLHYSPLRLSGISLADGKSFFIHEKGNHDAKAELTATIEAFQDETQLFGKGKLKAACAFPARRIFLENNKLINKNAITCPNWERWIEEINPTSMSLVFSDAYPNNPASMFGHTFIRFNKKNKTNDLLDYGASYEAITDPSDNAIIYTLKGLFGGYPGLFDLHPYYKKVNSYSNSEGRNLWEYKLKLTKDQVFFLLAHVWEIYNTTYFDYYFLDENCSYHLLELIQIVSDKKFRVPLRWFYLPRDIVIELFDQGLLEEPIFRPSLKEQFRQRFESLSKKDQRIIRQAYQNKSLDLNKDQIDAMIHLMQLDRYRAEGKLDQEELQFLNQLFLKRSKIKEEKKEITYRPTSTTPHLGHGTERFRLGQSYQHEQMISHVSYRSGYHSLTESDLGYSPFSEFTFLGGDLNYLHKEKKISYDHINVISVTSLHPWSFYYSQLSWRIQLINEELMETDSVNDHATNLKFHLGLSYGNDHYILSLLAGAKLRYSSHFNKNFEFGPSADFIFGYQIFNRAKLIMDINYYANLIDKSFPRVTINPIFNYYISRNVDIELFYKHLTNFNKKKYGIHLGYSF